MDLLIASTNQGKIAEIKGYLRDILKEIHGPEQSLEVVEDGLSFYENALLKAKAYYRHYKKPVLSDDSGLIVDALPEELGLHSARFGGEGLSDRERSELLLKKMVQSELEDRSAHFQCVLCFYQNDEEYYFFEGRLEGVISKNYLEGEGFGYDPIFMPQGGENLKSLAQLPEWKKKHSHRAKALQSLANFLPHMIAKNKKIV